MMAEIVTFLQHGFYIFRLDYLTNFNEAEIEKKQINRISAWWKIAYN